MTMGASDPIGIVDTIQRRTMLALNHAAASGMSEGQRRRLQGLPPLPPGVTSNPPEESPVQAPEAPKTAIPAVTSTRPPVIRRLETQRELAGRIIRTVCAHFGMTLAEMLGPGRRRELAIPRRMAYALVQELGKFSTTQIGKMFGGRDHATIMHGIERHRQVLRIASGFMKPAPGTQHNTGYPHCSVFQAREYVQHYAACRAAVYGETEGV